MSGKDDSAVGKRHQFILDSLHQVFVAAARKVCASDAALEEHVAGNHESVFLVIQDYAAGRMTGDMNHFQCPFSDLDFITLIEIVGNLHSVEAVVEAEHYGLLPHALSKNAV